MPRAPRITAAEFGKRNPQAKGVFRTGKGGQKFFIAFEKKHRFPQGKGVRVTFGRGTGGNLTNELRNIKRNQERAERKVKIKKGIGLFDNPLSNQPNVIGVKRVVRKKQVAAQIRKAKASGRPIPKRISMKEVKKFEKRNTTSTRKVQQKSGSDIVVSALTGR